MTLRRVGETVELAVRDHGPGIPAGGRRAPVRAPRAADRRRRRARGSVSTSRASSRGPTAATSSPSRREGGGSAPRAATPPLRGFTRAAANERIAIARSPMRKLLLILAARPRAARLGAGGAERRGSSTTRGSAAPSLDGSYQHWAPERPHAAVRPRHRLLPDARAVLELEPRGARPPDGGDLRRRRRRGDQLVVGVRLARGPAAAGGDRGRERARARGRRAPRAVPGRTLSSLEGDVDHLKALGIYEFYVYEPQDLPTADWKTLTSASRTCGSSRRPRCPGYAAAGGFAGLYTYDILVYGGLHVRPDLRRGAARSTCSARRRSGPASTPSARTGDMRREAAAERCDLRRDVAGRPRRAGRPRHDHELQRVERGHADRARGDLAARAATRPTRAPTACAGRTPHTPISRAPRTGRGWRRRPRARRRARRPALRRAGRG